MSPPWTNATIVLLAAGWLRGARDAERGADVMSDQSPAKARQATAAESPWTGPFKRS